MAGMTNLKTMVKVAALGSLALAVACVGKTETPLATEDTSAEGGQGLVACATFLSGGGAQLVDPPRMCTAIYSSCTDGHIYEMQCDGLGCICFFDGWPQDGSQNDLIVTPRCPLMDEAAKLCGWPIGLGPNASFGTGAIQGLPCDVGISEGTNCECVDGRFMCPGIDGCNMVGDFEPSSGELPSLHFLADGTYYTAEVTASASFDQVVAGTASGSFGTWSLAGDVLSVRSREPDGDANCSGAPGRYAVRFNGACELTELSLLDDPCEARAPLARLWTAR